MDRRREESYLGKEKRRGWKEEGIIGVLLLRKEQGEEGRRMAVREGVEG